MVNMATTIDDARAAKSEVKKVFSRVPGLMGVGLTRHQGGYAVKVNLKSSPVGKELPTEVNGVPVVLEIVGGIRAY
jgi:hypothetical protein